MRGDPARSGRSERRRQGESCRLLLSQVEEFQEGLAGDWIKPFSGNGIRPYQGAVPRPRSGDKAVVVRPSDPIRQQDRQELRIERIDSGEMFEFLRRTAQPDDRPDLLI